MNKIGYIKLNLKIKKWNHLLSKIDDFDLYEPLNKSYGKEYKPHITIFYGLDENVDNKGLFDIIDNIDYSKIDIKINNIDFFENKDCDIIKISIESSYIRELNSLFSKFPNTNKYIEYNPHITIAFLKKGCVEKYKNIIFNSQIKIDKAILKFKFK